MAQSIALRLACEAHGSRLVAMHPSAHIPLHERSNYQLLDHFQLLTLGEAGRVWDASHLAAVPDRLAAALYELPMREIGGQLPAWEKLAALKAACRDRGLHFHLDGARLWEAAAGYGKTPAEVCEGFDSVYVSFYKGIGSMGGAMLVGGADFIAQARVWMKRMGGNLWQRAPYVVSAAMPFDARLAAMPAYFARAKQAAALLGEFDAITVNPAVPQVNLFHLHLPFGDTVVNAARNRLAEQDGIWIGGAQPGATLHRSYIEWYVGDNLLSLPDDVIRAAVSRFLTYCRGLV
jgi:threonine aldolase